MNKSNRKSPGNIPIIIWAGIVFSAVSILLLFLIGTEYISRPFHDTHVYIYQNDLSRYFIGKYLGNHLSYVTYQITNKSGVNLWTTSQQDPDNGCSVKHTTYYSFGRPLLFRNC